MSYGDFTSPPFITTPTVPPGQTINDDWSDTRALQIVRSDFAYAEAYRTQAHDWRYRNADELYLAWAGQRYWDGTRVPRSSLGIYVVFEQVESFLPKLVASICDPQSYDFKSSDLEAALAWKRLVLDQLGEVNYVDHIRRVCKSTLIYGNGILEVGFEPYTSETMEFNRSFRPKRMGMMVHPSIGRIAVPIETEEDYRRKAHTETKQRPYVRYISIKDVYVDPNNESPWIQDGGYFIKRTYMRLRDLQKLRGRKNFNIPDDHVLAEYSKAKTTANQDVTKLSSELFRYTLWNPSQDYSSDPSQKRIEVIEYTKPDRKVWMLNREHIAYNQPNRYGQINYFSMHYADVLDRWHALALSDVAEGEQRLQQAIINARVDELALALHPPTYKRRGVTVPAYQLRRRPGAVVEVEDPKGDIQQAEIMNVTQQAYIEVEASQRRAQQITGISDLAALGSPTMGGNSANRTATGVNTQVGATADRARYIVQNAETLLIEPMLNAVITYDKKFLDMKQAAAWLRLDPKYANLDPLKVMNAKVKAECRASIRMAAKLGFLQHFPMLAQTVLNPEVLQLLAQQQKKTIDVEVLERMLMDAINYAPGSPLIVPMQPQQMQAMQQPPPAEKLKAAVAQQQMQADSQDKSKQIIGQIIKELVKQGFQSHVKYAQMDNDAQLALAQGPQGGEGNGGANQGAGGES